jgi:hypothetical protein
VLGLAPRARAGRSAELLGAAGADSERSEHPVQDGRQRRGCRRPRRVRGRGGRHDRESMKDAEEGVAEASAHLAHHLIHRMYRAAALALLMRGDGHRRRGAARREQAGVGRHGHRLQLEALAARGVGRLVALVGVLVVVVVFALALV